jgi:hypothetical protein
VKARPFGNCGRGERGSKYGSGWIHQIFHFRYANLEGDMRYHRTQWIIFMTIHAPQPLDTSSLEFPEWLLPLIERLAEARA